MGRLWNAWTWCFVVFTDTTKRLLQTLADKQKNRSQRPASKLPDDKADLVLNSNDLAPMFATRIRPEVHVRHNKTTRALTARYPTSGYSI